MGVTLLTVHEGFDSLSLQNDICMLRLADRLQYSKNVQPASFPYLGEIFPGMSLSRFIYKLRLCREDSSDMDGMGDQR